MGGNIQEPKRCSKEQCLGSKLNNLVNAFRTLNGKLDKRWKQIEKTCALLMFTLHLIVLPNEQLVVLPSHLTTER